MTEQNKAKVEERISKLRSIQPNFEITTKGSITFTTVRPKREITCCVI